MLVVGQVGWGKPHPTNLTPDEQYAHSPSLRAPNGVLELFEKQRNVFFDEITSFLKQ